MDTKMTRAPRVRRSPMPFVDVLVSNRRAEAPDFRRFCGYCGLSREVRDPGAEQPAGDKGAFET